MKRWIGATAAMAVLALVGCRNSGNEVPGANYTSPMTGYTNPGSPAATPASAGDNPMIATTPMQAASPYGNLSGSTPAMTVPSNPAGASAALSGSTTKWSRNPGAGGPAGGMNVTNPAASGPTSGPVTPAGADTTMTPQP